MHTIHQKGSGFVVVEPGGNELHESPIPAADAAQIANLLNHHDNIGDLRGGGVIKSALKSAARKILINAVKKSPAVVHGERAIQFLSGLRRARNGKKHIVEDKHKRLARLAADAYKPVNERAEKGYRKDLSTDETAVYDGEDENDPYVIAHRGTANMDDVLTDGKLALGRLATSDRYARSKATVENARNILGGRSLHTGHSLGGTLAQDLGDDAVVFNPGSGLNAISGKAHPDSHTVYHTSGDPISVLSTLSAECCSKNAFALLVADSCLRSCLVCA